MSFRKVDPITNDWNFGNSNTNYATGNEGIALDVQTAVLQWQNDWFLDLTKGINWEVYLSVPNQRQNIINAIKAMVASRNGVASVKEVDVINVDLNKGIASIEIVFTTTLNLEVILSLPLPNGNIS